MKVLEFKEYSKVYQDVDGDDHVSTVRAAVITEDLARVQNDQGNKVAREVNTFTGARKVVVGDVFVELPGKEGVYDHLTAEGWESSGYTEGQPGTAVESDVEPEEDNSDGDGS